MNTCEGQHTERAVLFQRLVMLRNLLKQRIYAHSEANILKYLNRKLIVYYTHI